MRSAVRALDAEGSDGQPPGAPPPAVRRLRRTGEACLWAIVIGVAVAGALHVAAVLRLVVLPVLLAVVMATFLTPPVTWLKRHQWPAGLASAAVVGLALFVIGGTGALIVPSVIDEFSGLDVGVAGGIDTIQRWVEDSPLPVSGQQAAELIQELEPQVRSSLDVLARQAVSGALVALEVVTGVALSIVILFFLLRNGERIWSWLVGLSPPDRRRHVNAMGGRVWNALGGFLRPRRWWRSSTRCSSVWRS